MFFKNTLGTRKKNSELVLFYYYLIYLKCCIFYRSAGSRLPPQAATPL